MDYEQTALDFVTFVYMSGVLWCLYMACCSDDPKP